MTQVVRLRPGTAPGVRALLDRLNAFEGPRLLRHWQAAALRERALRVASPLDGAELRCDATLWQEHALFAYRFRHGAATMWLMTHGCKTGWRLSGLALVPHGMAFALDDDEDAALVGWHLEAIAQLAAPDAPMADPARFRVVAGHPNFAHHLWNELPALAAVTDPAPELLVLWEPILPFDRLVAWPGPVRRSSEAAERPATPSLLPGVLLPLGSTRIPLPLAERVRAACAEGARLPAGRDGAPAVSLGLRTMHRHGVNQLDYARALLARLPSGVDVFLDGFALPWDIDVPGRHDAALFRGWQRGCAGLARALMDMAPAGGPHLVDATGLSVAEAIALGGRLRAHVAPHGTQQHKFGWLWPVPGVVHSSPHVAQGDQAWWVADQSEAAGQVTYLPAAMVAAVRGTGPHAGHPWYDDYRFVDAEAAAAFTAKALAPYLAR